MNGNPSTSGSINPYNSQAIPTLTHTLPRDPPPAVSTAVPNPGSIDTSSSPGTGKPPKDDKASQSDTSEWSNTELVLIGLGVVVIGGAVVIIAMK